MTAMGFWSKVHAGVFWSFPRGSWQYDLIVVAILAFIFLTPKEFFGDQPRPPLAQQVEELSDGLGTVVFWVEPSVLAEAPEEQHDARLRELLKQRSGKNYRIVSVKPAAEPEGKVHALIVYARP